MRNKRGQEWTMAKLLTIILAVVVMALVIYGITVRGFGPLGEKIEGAFNEVLIMFGIKKPVSNTYDCNEKFLHKVPQGEDLMNDLGLSSDERQKVKFRLCKTECKLTNTGFGSYRIGEVDGNPKAMNFDRRATEYYVMPWEGCDFGKECGRLEDSWRPYSDYLQGSSKVPVIEMYWNLFGEAIEAVEKTNPSKVKSFFEEGFTDKIVIGSDGAGPWDDKVGALWKNGKWEVYLITDSGTKPLYEGEDTAKAIEVFKGEADDAVDDNVFYKEESVLPVGEMSVGNTNNLGQGINFITKAGNNELDDKNELESLVNYVEERIKVLSSASLPTESEIKEIGTLIDGQKFSANGVDYMMSLDDGKVFANAGGLPIIKLEGSDGKDYGLQFSKNSIGSYIWSSWRHEQTGLKGIRSANGRIGVINYPLELVMYNLDGTVTAVGHQRDYKLLEDDFKEFKKVRVVRDFLISVCR